MTDLLDLQRATVAKHIPEENNHNWPGVYNTFRQGEVVFYAVSRRISASHVSTWTTLRQMQHSP